MNQALPIREATVRPQPNRFLRGVFLAGLFVAALCPASDAAAAFERKAWQSDFAFLKKDLELRYANLAWFASPQSGIDLPALDRRATRALAAAENDEDAKAALLAFVAGFHDGHFSQLASLLAAAGGSAEPPPAELDKMDAAAGCAALGYAPTRSVPFSLPFESLNGFALERGDVPHDFRSGVFTTADGKQIGVVRIRYFRQRDYSPPCEREWAVARRTGKPIDADALRNQIDQEWFAALAAQLRRFRADKMAAVVVDVGGNGGGNDAGDWSTRLFSAQPVRSARLLMVAAPAAAGNFDEQLESIGKALAAHPQADAPSRQILTDAAAEIGRRKAAIDSRHCDLSWAWREQRPWNPAGCSRLIDAGFASGSVDYLPAGKIAEKDLAAALYWPTEVDAYRGAWSGPVYVLTDGKTYSSAEMFTASMHDNGIAKTVGATTGGDGCGFMQNDPPVVLPHSRLRFRVPDCVRLRADGSDEVAGIRPDLPVLPTEGESDRARAARALAAIEADLRDRMAAPPQS